MNISSNISSIQAHQTMMNTSATNVANVNSDGYTPSETRVVSSENSVKANTFKANDNGSKMSQTELSKEITNQIIAQDATEANVTALKAQDDILGSLLDIKA
jgi:flagellar hook protein FlgE